MGWGEGVVHRSLCSHLIIRLPALEDCPLCLRHPEIEPWPLDPLWMAIPVKCNTFS